MLITFTCNAYGDLTYFSDIANGLLKLMGHSGTIPGAIKAADVGDALTRLKQGVAAISDNSPTTTITLATRAVPLINLLTAALNQQADVLWHD